MVALIITADGTKIPVGLSLTATPRTSRRHRLWPTSSSGALTLDVGILCVIDGAKALAAGVQERCSATGPLCSVVFCTSANVEDHCLRSSPPPSTASSLAFNDAQPDPAKGLRASKGIARELEDDHPAAAASLREGSTTCSPCAASA